MGLFDRLRGELIDIIQWLDESNNTLVYRFERFQNEIKNGAKLIVREGQVAVFISEGKLADVFSPGTYTLTTRNLPILSTLQGWKYGFESPFKAEVYFVNTKNITDRKWGTKNPIILNDRRFGMLEIRAFGTYVMRVKDAGLFIKEIVGTDGNFTTDEITEQLKSLIVTRFTDAIGEANLPVENYAANVNEVSGLIFQMIGPEFEKYGIELTKFLIENVSMPDEIKAEIFELSRLNAIDLGRLTQMKAAKALEKAADNEHSIAGAGMGLSMGYGMAGHIAEVYSNSRQASGPPPNQGPPPIPSSMAIFLVLNGKQAGPFELDVIKQMAAQNEITKETLVWHSGMADWAKAGWVTELKGIFTTPPPIPQ